MKHLMKICCRMALIAVVIAAWLPAGAMIYTWDRHNLAFEVPDGGFVTYNSNSHFEVRWDEMVVSITLYDKSYSTEEQIHDDLLRDAFGYNLYDTSEGKVKNKFFKGISIEGTMPDGSRARITSLSSKNTNLLVKVTVNYLYGNREMVDDIVKSFTEGAKEIQKKKQKQSKEQRKQKVQKKADADRQKREQLQKEQEEQQRLQEEQRRKNEKIYEV